MNDVNTTLKVIGDVEITLKNNDNIKQHVIVKNLVVTSGKNWIVSRIAGTETSQMIRLAIGTGNNPQLVTNTSLQAEVARIALTSTATSNYIAYSTIFPSGVGVGSITEAGIFNAASAGTMLCRTTFPAIFKDVLDTLTITWTITII